VMAPMDKIAAERIVREHPGRVCGEAGQVGAIDLRSVARAIEVRASDGRLGVADVERDQDQPL